RLAKLRPQRHRAVRRGGLETAPLVRPERHHRTIERYVVDLDPEDFGLPPAGKQKGRYQLVGKRDRTPSALVRRRPIRPRGLNEQTRVVNLEPLGFPSRRRRLLVEVAHRIVTGGNYPLGPRPFVQVRKTAQMMPDAARGHRPLPTVGRRQELVGPSAYVGYRDGSETPVSTEELDRSVETFLRHFEPVLGEFLRLCLRNQVRGGKVSQVYLPCVPVECASPTYPVELLQPPSEQHLRRSLVGGGEFLFRRDERFPAPADVGVIAQVRVGAPGASPLPPVDA